MSSVGAAAVFSSQSEAVLDSDDKEGTTQMRFNEDHHKSDNKKFTSAFKAKFK
jgi:hypothetical protein